MYNTEFGYITSPPAHDPGVYPPPSTAASLLNNAEYMLYRTPGVASTDQYLLQDQPLSASGFWTGLLLINGAQQATFAAYRMPLWLPVNTTKRGRSLEVWGGVRPAPLAQTDTGQPQAVSIQFRASGASQFGTLQSVTITNPRGYFDVHVLFPASGQVRLAWTYPANDATLQDPVDASQTIYSRVASVVLH
jgi:hypothetical protein